MIEHKNAWLRALDEALVSAHLGFASVSDDYETARKKLNALIDWHVAVATDPAVNGGRQLVPVEPMTDAEIVDAFCETPGIYQFIEAFRAGVRFAERRVKEANNG